MKTIPVGTRLDLELHETFMQEMARRGHKDKSQFLRNLVRDALAGYDSYSEQIIQTQLAILEHLKRLQEIVGATVHLGVEQNVLGLPQGANESPEAYKDRLKNVYRETVFDALAKGARIAAVSSNKSGSPKVGHDR
jgi:hypothetical protein